MTPLRPYWPVALAFTLAALGAYLIGSSLGLLTFALTGAAGTVLGAAAVTICLSTEEEEPDQ